MKWMRNRFLLLSYAALLAIVAAVGCTSKEDPSEVLIVCGNHTCGELAMVTTDTSSDGFHYLNAKLSPDQSRIMFTGDWWALPPSESRDVGDDPKVNNRQVLVIPVREGIAPALTLAEQGAQVVKMAELSVVISGQSTNLRDAADRPKSSPVWESDSTIVYAMAVPTVGYRIFRVSVATLGGVGSQLGQVLYMEPSDANSTPLVSQHLDLALSPSKRWLVFTRSACVLPDSFETCSGVALWALDMTTASLGNGFGAMAYPLTNEYSRIEAPSWSPDGTKLVFSGSMDLLNSGNDLGTEIFTIDVDTVALAAGTPQLDDHMTRLTYTHRPAGDPIASILNSSPVYSSDMSGIYFVSTRRAPSITLHDRNIWRIPSDGSRDPEIYFFSRLDDVDPTINADGSLLLSSSLGFPTEMLDRLEEEAYQGFVADNPLGLDEVQLRAKAAAERRKLEFFEGVMSHLYIYRP